MEFSKMELEEKGKRAKLASKKLSFLPSEVKNESLIKISESILARQGEILSANKLDCKRAKADGMSEAMLDRLFLSPDRLQAMARDVRTVASLPDPVGEVIEERVLPNGLQLIKRRVPLGVIGAIYESRPNVTVDIATLCLKSGNACILRGGKESLNSNRVLSNVVKEAAQQAGIPEGAIEFIESTSRAIVEQCSK